MNIHQLSVRYQPDQDRILLSMNTTEGQEIQVWLTRRITMGLWPLFNRIGIDHFAIPADAKSDGFVDLKALDHNTRTLLADARRQEVLETLDFATPYKTGASSKPLGESPMLLTEINLTPRESGDLHIRFNENLGPESAPRSFEMVVPSSIYFSMLQLLGQSVQQSGWSQGAQHEVLNQEPEQRLLDAKRPVYLN